MAEIFSKLTFWYRLPYLDLCQMPFSAIQKYLERLSRRQAEWRMLMAEAAMIPHIEQDDRTRWMDDLLALIGEGNHPEPQTASPAVLGTIGIQVERVK